LGETCNFSDEQVYQSSLFFFPGSYHTDDQFTDGDIAERGRKVKRFLYKVWLFQFLRENIWTF